VLLKYLTFLSISNNWILGDMKDKFTKMFLFFHHKVLPFPHSSNLRSLWCHGWVREHQGGQTSHTRMARSSQTITCKMNNFCQTEYCALKCEAWWELALSQNNNSYGQWFYFFQQIFWLFWKKNWGNFEFFLFF